MCGTVVVVVVVVLVILFKVSVVNIVDNFTGLKESCTVCSRESKLVRVEENIFETGLVTGREVVLILLDCLALEDTPGEVSNLEDTPGEVSDFGLAVGTFSVAKVIVLFLELVFFRFV